MTKSFCIKTNNLKLINNLITEIEKIEMNDIYISQRKFALYENLIVHYIGKEKEKFITLLSDKLTNIIISFYQKYLLKKIINENYFYFFEYEKNEIIETCINQIDELSYKEQYQSIYNECSKYIKENKSLIIDGFVKFRLYKYVNILDKTVEYGINKYLVQREYFEFVRLLKEYISSSTSNYSTINLIYSKDNVILLDENNQNIPIENNISNSKYLSDISFSKNDYCLNALLNLLPKEIKLHSLSQDDEFIETLKLIFSDRITVCNSCELCLTQKENIKGIIK